MSAKKIAICTHCRQKKPILGRGLCVKDYFKLRSRAMKAGTWKARPQRARGDLPVIPEPVPATRWVVEVGREGRISLLADALITLVRPGLVVVLVKGHGISGSLILPDDVAKRVLMEPSLT